MSDPMQAMLAVAMEQMHMEGITYKDSFFINYSELDG